LKSKNALSGSGSEDESEAGSGAEGKEYSGKKPENTETVCVGKSSGSSERKSQRLLESYAFLSNKMPITVRIFTVSGEFVPLYEISISKISENTEIILEKIREELITEVNLGLVDITSTKKTGVIEQAFMDTIELLVRKHFPDIDDHTTNFLTAFLIQRSLGMGNVEILMDDPRLEEVAINNSDEPVWVYHKNHGWLKTNVIVTTEDQIKHYATMIGRRIGRQISVLEPLLDAHLSEGDRANATLLPISTKGNTITLRKFSRDPFTITHFIKYKTIHPASAALIWLAMQFELSAIIAGGTASGKTATLNVLASFIPPNQRIVSIEDTRELQLPKYLHWVPLSTRMPNAEKKGEISMADLLVNSLRMRPDRILVGEVRRQKEAETLFEAIHTGHSCYTTFHANSAEETLRRFTHPPINVPETLMPAISMIIMQFRNRRSGIRRTFQIAEITEDSKVNLLKQYDTKKDVLVDVNKSRSLLNTIELYTGYSPKEINTLLREKEDVLKYLIRNNVDHVDTVGRAMAEYYTNKEQFMKLVRSNKRQG